MDISCCPSTVARLSSDVDRRARTVEIDTVESSIAPPKDSSSVEDTRRTHRQTGTNARRDRAWRGE